MISKSINVKTDTNVPVGCIGSIDYTAHTLPKYNTPQYIYNCCFELNRNGIYTAELNIGVPYFLVHITEYDDKHQARIGLFNKLHTQHIINKNIDVYKITGTISRNKETGLFILIYIDNGKHWILKPVLNPQHRRLEKDEALADILYETHFLIYSRVNMQRLAPSSAPSTNRKRSYSQTRMNSQHYRNPNSITKNAPRSKQSSYNYRKNATRNQSNMHKDTILDVIPKQTKYGKLIPTPIINTNKQYYNKAIQNSKCTTDHLNILQYNIMCRQYIRTNRQTNHNTNSKCIRPWHTTYLRNTRK